MKTQKIIDLVKKCGDIMKNATNKTVDIKDDKSFVTDYDVKIQNILKEGLYKIMPEASFLGEEEGGKDYNKDGLCFVCDPIDGTTNFIMGYKASGVSVALLDNGKPILGVIYNPYLGEMYIGQKNNGSTCNGVSIKTSDREMKNSIVIFGTNNKNASDLDKTFELAKQYYKKCIDIRRAGSAVIDLSNVANGRASLYFELKLYPWDFCAGALIVEEAGGIVLQENGKPIDDYFKPQAIFAFENKKEADKFIAECS